LRWSPDWCFATPQIDLTRVHTRPNLLLGESLPPAPSQKRSIAKRARLHAAALALFGENGYEATSIAEIARRAKLAVGTFYQHYRSKRQLLLALMDDLLEKLSRLNLQPQQSGDIRAALAQLLTRAFAADLHYLGAYRAWQEGMLSDRGLAQRNTAIRSWTAARVTRLFRLLQRHPAARQDADIRGLAMAMDTFFWSLLGQALHMPKSALHRQIDAATHLIFHGLFQDRSGT
jgi:AcrR family transcriptional regulator